MHNGYALPLLMICIELTSCDKAVRSPAFALVDDDPCLRDPDSQDFQCGTALLQSGNRRLPPRKAAYQSEASKVGKKAKAPLLEDLLEVAGKASYNVTFIAQLESLVSDSSLGAKGVHGSLRFLQEEHSTRLSTCDAELRLRIESELKLTDLYNQWLHLDKACQADEHLLRHELDLCLQAQAVDKRENQTSGCTEHSRLMQKKVKECSSIRAATRSTGCARASQAAQSCSSYSLCRRRMSAALAQAGTAAKAVVSGQHQSRWLATATSKCLRDRLSDKSFNHSSALLAAKACQSLAEKEIQALGQPKELPAALECNARSEEQGLCEELEPAETWEQSAPSFSPQALGADLAKEVAGVSFMQEGIERADALPRHLHKVLMDSMVSVPMFLALFTLVMLWARCTVALTSREQKEPSTPSAVDAWCVQGAEAECDAKWLCHELMVPRNSRCAVTVPRMLKEGPWTAVVSDKMGQCMFKVCTTEAHGLQLNIARQDGAVLAACQISLEGDGSCQILKDNGESPFATLEWEALQARGSWFRWKSRAGPGGFVLRSRLGLGVLLQVTGGLEGLDGRLHVQDARKRSVAEATLCRAGGSMPDTVHVQVVSPGATDLGLVLAVLLAVDRLQASSSSQ